MWPSESSPAFPRLGIVNPTTTPWTRSPCMVCRRSNPANAIMTADDTEVTRARKRVTNACRACKQRKVKCTGNNPCPGCNLRGQECIYDEAERKVVVLERHLRALQSRASGRMPGRRDTVEEANDTEAEEATIVALAPNQTPPLQADEEYVTGSPGPEPTLHADAAKHGFMKFSPWDYITAASRVSNARSVDTAEDYSTFDFKFETMVPHSPCSPQAQQMPPLDVIIHLVRVADFHLNCVLRFFDVEDILHRIESSRDTLDPSHPATWKAQIFVIIATGKLYTEKGATKRGPPGFSEFLSADQALPSMLRQTLDPLGAVETLCLLASYAQSANLHDLSCVYIGQACRVVDTSAFQMVLKAGCNLNTRRASYLEQLRQTARILSLRVSIVCGRSSGLAPPPPSFQATPSDSVALKISLELATLLSNSSRALGCLGAETQNLPTEATMATSLESMRSVGTRIHELQQGHGKSMTRQLRWLHLWFCHGIVAMTRPALLRCKSQAPSQTTIFRLAEICARYSFLALKLVSRLQEEGLLESYSFDLVDLTVISAVSVLLRDSMLPSPDTAHAMHAADMIFVDMEKRGNLTAGGLQRAISRLQRLTTPLTGGEAPIGTLWGDWDGGSLDEMMLKISDPVGLQHSLAVALETEIPEPSAAGLSALGPSNTLTEHGPFLEDHSDNDHFTFDMEDLQWLDAVQ